MKSSHSWQGTYLLLDNIRMLVTYKTDVRVEFPWQHTKYAISHITNEYNLQMCMENQS